MSERDRGSAGTHGALWPVLVQRCGGQGRLFALFALLDLALVALGHEFQQHATAPTVMWPSAGLPPSGWPGGGYG